MVQQESICRKKFAAKIGQFVRNFALTIRPVASIMEDKEVSASAPTRKELACSMDTDPGSNMYFARNQRSFQVRAV